MSVVPVSLPIASFRKKISVNGWKFSVLKSCVQKSIRIGDEFDAVWSIGESFSFSQAENKAEAQRILTNLKNRLRIILLEDIGNLSLLDPRFIHLETNQDISDFVHVMCSSTKARICSHARAFAKAVDNKDNDLSCLSPFDVQLVKHVRQQKIIIPEPKWRLQLINALENKCNSAILWAFQIASHSPKRRIGRKTLPVFQIFKVLEVFVSGPLMKKLYKLHSLLKNLKESFMVWMLPILNYLRPRREAPIVFTPAACIIEHKQKRKHREKKLADSVYDKHCGFKTDSVTFATVGAIVSPENKQQIRTGWKSYYLHLKKLEVLSLKNKKNLKRKMPPLEMVPVFKRVKSGPFIKNERDRFNFQVRAQLCCSESKTDVYFAFDNETKKNVVVKGPLPQRSSYASCVQANNWKRSVGLPYLETIRQAELGVDMFSSAPIGVRKKYENGAPGHFIIFDSLLDRPPTSKDHVLKSSKRYADEEVIDWKNFSQHVFTYKNWNNYSAQVKKDYVHGLIGRYINSFGDFADRNFMLAKGRLYSLDEDTPVKKVQAIHKLIKSNAMKAHLLTYVKIHEREIRKWLEGITHDVSNSRLTALNIEPCALFALFE